MSLVWVAPRGEGVAFHRETNRYGPGLANPENWCLLARVPFPIPHLPHGPVAQLIERVVRNDEVVGLIPIWSTIFQAGTSDSGREIYPGWSRSREFMETRLVHWPLIC